MYKFEVIKKENIPWETIENCYNQTVYKSKAWMDFLCETQNITPFVIEIFWQDKLLGYFVGEKFSKIINIVASPFEGWTTSYQGLSLIKQISPKQRIEIYKYLINYLFKNNLCVFFQASDWYLDLKDVEISDLDYEVSSGYVLDLTQSEEDIYRNFSSSSCKYSIKKALKSGVKVRIAENIEDFISNYYDQLIEVFQKQGLTPTYKIDRVKALVKYLNKLEKVLLLESINAEEKCIATGIFVGDNKNAFFWGGASYREYQSLCPNEILMFEALKYWKSKGIVEFEFGGGRKYKEKYGPIPYERPKIVAYKYKSLIHLKNISKSIFYKVREYKSLIPNLKTT